MVGSEVLLMATILGFTRTQLCRFTRDNVAVAVKSSRSFDAHGKLIENTKCKLKAAVFAILFWARSGQTDSPFSVCTVEVKQKVSKLSPRPCGQLFIGK
jgi:hypothetical protein